MKYAYLLSFVIPLLLLAACKKDELKPVHLQSITLNRDTVNVLVGAKASIIISLNPSNAVDTALVFTSSDTAIAKITRPGSITGIKVGTAVITIKNSANTVSKTCVVNVLPVGVTAIALNKTTLNILIGNVDSLKATLSPPNASNINVTWSSSDNTIASVNSKGVITAIKLGTVTVTATSQDGKFSAACKVQVQDMTSFVYGIANYDLLTINGKQGENIWLEFENHSPYPILITEWDVYNSKNALIGTVDGSPGFPIDTVTAGQIFHSTTESFIISQVDPGQINLQNWPVEVLFTCNLKKYKMTLTFDGYVVTDL